MYEVIIERPRGGAGWGRPWPRVPWHLLDRDDDGEHDGGPRNLRMGPRRRTKWLNENLAPLCRFLLRSVGRPWNEVHAEICTQLTPRSTLQKHVLDHLYQYVERHPVIIDGWPHRPMAWGSQRADYFPLSGYGRSFYVCPQTGRLLRAFKPRERATKAKPQAKLE